MKVTAEIDWVGDCYGDISIDDKVRIELVDVIVEKLHKRLIELWEPEIINAVKDAICKRVTSIVTDQFDNFIGEKINLYLDDKVKELSRELLKNKLSVMMDRLMREV
jgi:hypothetical protein